MNSVYFYKEQKKELHDFIELLLRYNQSLPEDKDWDYYMDIHIYNEDEGTIVEFDQKIECEGFVWIDENHYVEELKESNNE